SGATKGPPSPPKSLRVGDVSRKVQRLKQRATRTTGKVWALVIAAAKFPQGREFTLMDLAQSMKEPLPRVRSWHRVLARPAKRLQLVVFEKIPGEDRLVKFVMPQEIRKAVLATIPRRSRARMIR